MLKLHVKNCPFFMSRLLLHKSKSNEREALECDYSVQVQTCVSIYLMAEWVYFWNVSLTVQHSRSEFLTYSSLVFHVWLRKNILCLRRMQICCFTDIMVPLANLMFEWWSNWKKPMSVIKEHTVIPSCDNNLASLHLLWFTGSAGDRWLGWFVNTEHLSITLPSISTS